MKRLIALLMAATMMVSLAACSSEEGSGIRIPPAAKMRMAPAQW